MRSKEIKYFGNIGHIEIAADAEVFRPPVIATEERMNVLQSGLAGSGITKMTHVELAREGGRTRVIGRGVLLLIDGSAEDGSDSIFTGRALTEHIFMSRCLTDADAGDTRAFLAAVVLLLHQQVKLAERIIGISVLGCVILQRL